MLLMFLISNYVHTYVSLHYAVYTYKFVAAAHTYVWYIRNHTMQVRREHCFKSCVYSSKWASWSKTNTESTREVFVLVK